MSRFLSGPLNDMFGRSQAAKPTPIIKLVAIYRGQEHQIAKSRDGIWRVQLGGKHYGNSLLGDLIIQLEDLGAVVERRAA